MGRGSCFRSPEQEEDQRDEGAADDAEVGLDAAALEQGERCWPPRETLSQPPSKPELTT